MSIFNDSPEEFNRRLHEAIGEQPRPIPQDWEPSRSPGPTPIFNGSTREEFDEPLWKLALWILLSASMACFFGWKTYFAYQRIEERWTDLNSTTTTAQLIRYQNSVQYRDNAMKEVELVYYRYKDSAGIEREGHGETGVFPSDRGKIKLVTARVGKAGFNPKNEPPSRNISIRYHRDHPELSFVDGQEPSNVDWPGNLWAAFYALWTFAFGAGLILGLLMALSRCLICLGVKLN